MGDLAARLETFTNWQNKRFDAKQCAEAGFIYCPEEDLLKCVFCEGTIENNLKAHMPPIINHYARYPCCPIFTRSKPWVPDAHPEMREKYKRIDTFRKSPHYKSDEGLAEAGFFCSSPTPGGRVTCFCCGGHNDHDSDCQFLEETVLKRAPVHPEMESDRERSRTFKECDRCNRHWVNSGFFYSDTNQVTCFHCGAKSEFPGETGDHWSLHDKGCHVLRVHERTESKEVFGRYPLYGDVETRRSTFVHCNMEPYRKLARAGFFYDDDTDKIACYACGETAQFPPGFEEEHGCVKRKYYKYWYGCAFDIIASHDDGGWNVETTKNTRNPCNNHWQPTDDEW